MKQFFEVSAPKDCDVDELIFGGFTFVCAVADLIPESQTLLVVGIRQTCRYEYRLQTESIGESQVADVYASLPHSNENELRFRHCSDSSEHPLDSRVTMNNY